MLENLKSNNESLFLVSSAIHTKHGVYSAEQRLEQTLKTLKSIKNKCPADIIIVEGGDKPLTLEEQKILGEDVQAIISYADSPAIRQVLAVPNHDIVKNMAEIIMFGSTFQNMETDLDHKRYKRIFKMSGRYVLNDNFNYDTHYNAKDKIVIRGPFTSQFKPEITGQVYLQYMSRLWSFDADMLPYITDAYRKMYEHMDRRLRDGGYIDIEHLLYVYLGEDNIQKINKIGIEGNIAPNGVGVSD
jgi:hypothetical protein